MMLDTSKTTSPPVMSNIPLDQLERLVYYQQYFKENPLFHHKLCPFLTIACIIQASLIMLIIVPYKVLVSSSPIFYVCHQLTVYINFLIMKAQSP